MVQRSEPLHARWFGRADYREVLDVQHRLVRSDINHLLTVEHPEVYTTGLRKQQHNLIASDLGAELVPTRRGGEVTFHGPGQLVGYPILSLPSKRGSGLVATGSYVHDLESALISALGQFGVDAQRLERRPGIWLDAEGGPRKVAAVGVRLQGGRSMHGFAINVDTDLGWFNKIVPCGISDLAVTSLAAEGFNVSLRELNDATVSAVAETFGFSTVKRQDVVWRQADTDLAPFSRGAGPGEPIKPDGGSSTAVPVNLSSRQNRRLSEAGVTEGLSIGTRKPDWMKVRLETGDGFRQLKRKARDLQLVTVCEEAGCPNIFDCWNEGTATFMLLGDRCTRKCGFCLIDTRKPLPVDEAEPQRVAQAVQDMGLSFAVLTMVARDDLEDGGASIVADTIKAIRVTTPGVGVEALISDLDGKVSSLGIVADARPDVLNHNIETVARLQRAVRPSASYARSLGVLARAKAHGLTTKSGLIVGMGETDDEVKATLVDLAAIGVDIVTIGQYLRPTTNHIAIQRWVPPKTFEAFKIYGEQQLGIGVVESSPLTRSSHHAGSVAAELAG